MANYFRITGYNPNENYCFIMDSYGKFEKLWQFSSYVIQKGCKIIEASNDERFLDGNISKADINIEKIILRASADGKPQYQTHNKNGIDYKIVCVGKRYYIPDKNSV